MPTLLKSFLLLYLFGGVFAFTERSVVILTTTFILLLVMLFVFGGRLDRILAAIGTKRGINCALCVYIVGALLTVPFQLGIRFPTCMTLQACNLEMGKAAIWSLLWPLSWSVYAVEFPLLRFAVSVLLLLVLVGVAIGLDRIFSADDQRKELLSRHQQSPIRLHFEPLIAAFALIALLVAECALLSVSLGLNYGNSDGKAAQAIVHTILNFGGWFEVTTLNPLQGLGSQMLPMNAWANPAYWPFALFTLQSAADLSGLLAFVLFALACCLMARLFDVPLVPSAISAQLSILLFIPLGGILYFGSVFLINPGLALVYAPHVIALGVLSRVQPGRLLNLAGMTAVLFALLLYSIYCDPLWSMISGFSWAAAFAVVVLGPWNFKGVLVRFAVLSCCAGLLLLTGPLEYLYGLSQYTARVQFSEQLSRAPSFGLASLLLSQPSAPIFYFVCILGWIVGFHLLRGRARLLVIAAAVSFVFLLIYAGTFLILPGYWWLPLPIYIEHSLFPLFATAAVAGIWFGIHLLVSLDAVPFARFSRASARNSLVVAMIVVVLIPAVALSLLGRARTLGQLALQPWPNEPELRRFLTNNIGLGVDRRFRGSAYFLTENADEFATLNTLWMDSVPTANEYSQLVTPQSIYFIHHLFKRDLATDLNWLRPWINTSEASFPMLFRAYRMLGIRYVAGYARFSQADAEHFESISFPRHEPGKPSAQWVIYEIPDVNVGNYSPTEVTIARSGAQIIARLAAADFDFGRQAVLSAEISKPLVKARNMRLTVTRGGLHVAGSSDGTSLVLLPQQFSHCLRASDNRVRLVRVNLMMTGLLFSGEVDTDISFEYGIFSPRCRRADISDMRNLGIAISPRSRSSSADFLNEPALRSD